MTKHRIIRAGGWFAIPAVMIASLAGAAPTRATADLVTPRTLVIEHGTIHKFAQDGDFMTWIGGKHYVVHLRAVSGGPSWVLGNAGPGAAVGSQSASTIVLGGKRAVWVKHAGVMTREAAIYSAVRGQRKPSLVDVLGVTDYGGTYLTGLVADGAQTILYGEARVACEPSGCWLDGGGVHRFAGKPYPHRMRNIPPPFAIAASVGRVAVVPAVVTEPWGTDPAAAPDGPVSVYDLSGRLLARVVPEGTIREVVLAWPNLAVIVGRPDGTLVIERYNAARGELVTATPMPGASHLGIGAGGIVFLVGKSIYTIRDGQPALLWRATKKPIGLSIEGRRVAWAACGRIKALTLPR